jgi:peptidoglycan/xylan/chitin deacetylase (PgdA/CDA1 family)
MACPLRRGLAESGLLVHHATAFSDGADAVLGDIPLDPGSPPGFLSDGVRVWAEQRRERLAAGGGLELHDLVGGHLAVRRTVFEALGGFDENFTSGGSFGNEDLDFGVRLKDGYAIRFEPRAICRQRYIVDAQTLLRRSREVGQADARLAAKHAERAGELLAANEARRPLIRFGVRPLARVPGAVGALTWLAVRSSQHSTRWAQRVFYLARQAQYWAGVRQGDRGGRLLVLCYHALVDLRADPVLGEYGIPPHVLAAQLDRLRARGHCFVGGETVARFLARESGLPPKAVLVTFDDCYAELLDGVREVLRPRGIPALAFAVVGEVGGSNAWDQAIGARALPLLGREGLQELTALGVEVGCHARTHRLMTELTDRELVQETAGAADEIAALGLPRPRFFAYPHGEHDARVRRAVRSAGFAAAFGLTSAYARAGHSPFAVPRIEVLASDGPGRFALKTRAPRVARAIAAVGATVRWPFSRVRARLALIRGA